MRRLGPSLTHLLLQPRTRYVLAWMLAVSAAGLCLAHAWNLFAAPVRRDGNSGHTTIDFGGQWLMGRMLAEGLGEHLYHRNYQREVLREAYPRADGVPVSKRKAEEREQDDADKLMSWLMGQDDPRAAEAVAGFLTPLAGQDVPGVVSALVAGQHAWTADTLAQVTAPAVGGALYPPIHGLLMWPLGYLRPLAAYHTFQVVGLVLAFLTGWGLRLLAHGRIWWPVAVTVVLAFPGFGHSVNLGQNSFLSLALVVWGWTLLARGRPVWGGAVWGLLAFKPVWAAAIFLVPLLTRRGRVCLAMLASAAGLACATLPLVGWQAWLDWLRIGREAAVVYSVDENWVLLSRDLLNLPRRWLLDFNRPIQERDTLLATVAGWCILLVVLEGTTRLAVLRKDQAQAVTGPPAAFVFLSAWLCCFHFMYYEILLVALPVCLLFTEPARYLDPIFVAIVPQAQLPLVSDVARYYLPRRVQACPGGQVLVPVRPQNLCVVNNMVLTLLALLAVTEFLFPLIGIEVSASGRWFQVTEPALPQPWRFSTKLNGTPWSTLCILLLWLWCGWLWLRMPPPTNQGAQEQKTLLSDGKLLPGKQDQEGRE